MLRADSRQICEGLKDNIVKLGVAPCQRTRVQFFGTAQCFVILFFRVQQLFCSPVSAISICETIPFRFCYNYDIRKRLRFLLHWKKKIVL